MRLPDKLQRYYNLQIAGFPVKPMVAGPYGSDGFLEEAETIFDVYPVIMLRTAVDERKLLHAFKLPRRFNLRSMEEVEKAYGELTEEASRFDNPWIMAEPFYPNRNLLSINLMYSTRSPNIANLAYDVGHESTSSEAGGVPLLSLENLQYDRWKFRNNALSEAQVYRDMPGPHDATLERYVPKGKLFDAIDNLNMIIENEAGLNYLLGDANAITLDTIVQYPVEANGLPAVKNRVRAVLDYSRE